MFAQFELLQTDEGLVLDEAVGLHVDEIDHHGRVSLWTFFY